jgi:hypothetical protein
VHTGAAALAPQELSQQVLVRGWAGLHYAGASSQDLLHPVGLFLACARLEHDFPVDTRRLLVFTLPAPDTGGHELTSTYYLDGQISSQAQAGETLEYKLDPEGRTRETLTTEQGGDGSANTVTHFDGPGDAIAWTSEGEHAWTRNIPGVQGEIAAIQTNSGITLELHDLHGDIVGTASNSETASGLLTKYNSTALGEPSNGEATPKVAWLGEIGAVSELGGGAVTQDGVTYVPQLGHALQTQPIDVAVPINVISPYQAIEPAAIAESAGRESEIRVVERQRENREREEREKEEQERQAKREHELLTESPIGEVPTYEGNGGGECEGMLACIERKQQDPQIKCTLTTAIEKGYKATVYSWSWGECGLGSNYVLRRGSEVGGCVGEELEEAEEAPAIALTCTTGEGSGFNPEHPKEKGVPLKHGLLAATEDVKCEHGAKLFGQGEFEDPGFSHRLRARTPDWQCGEGTLEEAENIAGSLDALTEYIRP